MWMSCTYQALSIVNISIQTVIWAFFPRSEPAMFSFFFFSPHGIRSQEDMPAVKPLLIRDRPGDCSLFTLPWTLFDLHSTQHFLVVCKSFFFQVFMYWCIVFEKRTVGSQSTCGKMCFRRQCTVCEENPSIFLDKTYCMSVVFPTGFSLVKVMRGSQCWCLFHWHSTWTPMSWHIHVDLLVSELVYRKQFCFVATF